MLKTGETEVNKFREEAFHLHKEEVVRIREFSIELKIEAGLKEEMEIKGISCFEKL